MAGQANLELLGFNLQQLTALVGEAGEPPYRARQLFTALYEKRVSSLQQISTLSKSFRTWLAERGYVVGMPRVEKKFTSRDGTARYLVAFADGESVETVWMPEGDGGEAAALDGDRDYDRATICISSQVGCAVNCQFCMTALLGQRRNLTAGEIVGQVLLVLEDHKVEVGRERINLVFMGQGEPFLNYDNFMQAVRLLVEGAGIAESRMTVSTAGIVPRIADFGREAVRPKLAISLNGSNDEVRERVMPLNRKWDLEALMAAARAFPLRPRERLTFEYVLLEGVNDGIENAREVVELLRGLKAKVNLIALNPGPEIAFATPDDRKVRDFQRVLTAAEVPTFIRRPRGRDIYAACGQLKSTVG